jgi:hypothetical protein
MIHNAIIPIPQSDNDCQAFWGAIKKIISSKAILGYTQT